MNEITQAVGEIKSFVTGQIGKEAEARKELEQHFLNLQKRIDQHLRQPLGLVGQSGSTDPNYKGFWPSAKMAADFGALVLATASPSASVRESAAERVSKGGYTIRRGDGQFVKGDTFVKDMGAGVGASGGYLTADEFASQIIRNVEQFGVFRQYSTRLPMSSARQKWPKRTQGFTVYYPDEAQAATASDMTLDQVTLEAKKWAVLAFVSRELNEDSLIALGELVGMEFALAIAQAEDVNGFTGNGTGAFAGVTGVLESANVIAVTMEAGDTAFANLASKYFARLVAAVPSWAKRTDPAFYMSPEIVGTTMELVDGSGRQIYAHPNEGFPFKINGYPVREVTAMPGLADSGAGKPFIAFGSLRLWGFLGQRRGFTVEVSNEVRFLQDQVAIKAVPRQDIQEADGDAMAVLTTAAA
jgi:HK97 family phage major capsid protein